MAGARGCVSVISPNLRRGYYAETESVGDPRLIRSSQANPSRNLRGGILGKAGTSATGRSFAAGGGERGGGFFCDGGKERRDARGGAGTGDLRKKGGGGFEIFRWRGGEKGAVG